MAVVSSIKKPMRSKINGKPTGSNSIDFLALIPIMGPPTLLAFFVIKKCQLLLGFYGGCQKPAFNLRHYA